MASRPKFWPRPQTFGLGLASISLSYYVIGHFSGKNRVKFGNSGIFPAIILNRMLLIIIWYFFIIIFGLGLGLNLQKLASVSASRFWPRLTSVSLSSIHSVNRPTERNKAKITGYDKATTETVAIASEKCYQHCNDDK